MKDIPVFDTDTGVSTLLLKEIPYRQIAYVKVQSVQPGGLGEHLKECISFCRMCGAERVLAKGHPELIGDFFILITGNMEVERLTVVFGKFFNNRICNRDIIRNTIYYIWFVWNDVLW